MQPLPNSVSLSAPFPIEENSLDPSGLGLSLCEPPASSEVDLLDATRTVERYAKQLRRIARRMNPIEGIFVRVEGDRALGLGPLRRLLPEDARNPPRAT